MRQGKGVAKEGISITGLVYLLAAVVLVGWWLNAMLGAGQLKKDDDKIIGTSINPSGIVWTQAASGRDFVYEILPVTSSPTVTQRSIFDDTTYDPLVSVRDVLGIPSPQATVTPRPDGTIQSLLLTLLPTVTITNTPMPTDFAYPPGVVTAFARATQYWSMQPTQTPHREVRYVVITATPFP